MVRIRTLALALTFPIAIGACATIMQGTKQGVSISSNPTGAAITLDGQVAGVTPAVLQIPRKNSHVVKLELPGYQPYELAFTKSASGWVWGNIVFGGLVGLGVDAVTGGLYKLSPEAVTADMKTTTATVAGRRTIVVAVVMSPDPRWEKIGQLRSE